jgi:hypothetical protein
MAEQMLEDIAKEWRNATKGERDEKKVQTGQQQTKTDESQQESIERQDSTPR